jgi:hypothetical protein
MSHHQNAGQNHDSGKVQILGNDSDKMLFMAKLRYNLELNPDHHNGKPVSELWHGSMFSHTGNYKYGIESYSTLVFW